MSQLHEIGPNEFSIDPFTMIGREWMLVAAQKPDGTVNAMTAGWGGIGTIWNGPAAFIFVRETRYTKEFLDASKTFSLSVPLPQQRRAASYLGKVSGRDEDKIAKCGLTLLHDGETPYFAESSVVLICTKLYAQAQDEASFIDHAIVDRWYAPDDGGFHTMYVGSIDKILVAG